MHLPNNRFIATTTHFFISVIIFSLFVLFMLHLWFPTPYFSASGGWQGLKIVAVVDLVLGPLLTLIIFNIKKPRKELIRDLSIIATIQVGALIWGMTTVYQQRPLMVTFWDGKFHTLSADVLQSAKIDQEKLEPFGDDFPVYIYTQIPKNDEGKRQYLEKIYAGVSPNLQPELYQPLTNHFDAVLQYNIDISQKLDNDLELKDQIDTLLAKSKTKLEENYYLPLKSFYGKFILVFDKNNKRIGHLKYAGFTKEVKDTTSNTPVEDSII